MAQTRRRLHPWWTIATPKRLLVRRGRGCRYCLCLLSLRTFLICRSRRRKEKRLAAKAPPTHRLIRGPPTQIKAVNSDYIPPQLPEGLIPMHGPDFPKTEVVTDDGKACVSFGDHDTQPDILKQRWTNLLIVAPFTMARNRSRLTLSSTSKWMPPRTKTATRAAMVRSDDTMRPPSIAHIKI